MLRCLVLDLNSFFASCEQQEDPALRGAPVIVVQTPAETTSAIAASYTAKAFGIKTGTLVRDARRLCPDVKLRVARHQLYIDYHHRILAAVDKHIPIDQVMSIDEVACRLDKRQRDPAVAQELALNIKRQIQTDVGQCLTSSIGISANKLLAKLASNMQKPDGLVILPLDTLPRAIQHLTLEHIPGIGPNLAHRLKQAGLSDIPALWNCDAARLRAIWRGVGGLKMHDLLHGADITDPNHERASISHQHVLPPSARTVDHAQPILRELVVRAAQRLRSDKLYCRRLEITIDWLGHEHEPWSAKQRFAETQDTAELLRAFETQWASVPRLKPLRVGIALTGLVAEGAHQPDLFDKPRNTKLASAVDAVNAKFGKGTVTYGNAAPTQNPKIAFQHVPKREEF